MIHEGDREVQPHHHRGSAGQGAKARRKARRAEEARQLALRLHAAARERSEAWADDLAHPNIVFERTQELDVLHADKRDLRRDIYRAAPELEGSEVNRHASGRVAR